MDNLKISIQAIRQCASELEGTASKERNNNSNTSNNESVLLSISYNASVLIDPKDKDISSRRDSNNNNMINRRNTLTKKNEDSKQYNNINNKKINDFRNLVETEIEDFDSQINAVKEFMVADLSQFRPLILDTQTKPVTIDELTFAFKNAHQRLAENNRTNLHFRILENLPCTLDLHKSTLKTIVNNFMLNSLLNSSHNHVMITFQKFRCEDMIFWKEYNYIGNEMEDVDSYFCISVSDNGKGVDETGLEGIFAKQEYSIFNQQPSEQASLSVCLDLANSIGGCIFYTSIPSIFTSFTLCTPIFDSSGNYNRTNPKPGYELFKYSIDIPFIYNNAMRKLDHKCNSVLLVDASDSTRVLEYFQTKEIPFRHFTSGEECMRYIQDYLLHPCKKCPRMMLLVGERLSDLGNDALTRNVRMMDFERRIRVDLLSLRAMSEAAERDNIYDGHYAGGVDQLYEYFEWVKSANDAWVQRQEVKLLGLLVDCEEDEEQVYVGNRVTGSHPNGNGNGNTQGARVKERYNNTRYDKENSIIFKDRKRTSNI